MARRGGLSRVPIIGEMFGRIERQEGYGFSIYRLVNKLFGRGYKKTLDLTKNDYPLFRALFHGSTVPAGQTEGNNGEEFILAAALAKPIINTAAAFAVGSGFSIKLAGSADTDAIKTAEDEINEWISDNADILFDFIKFAYRDGDSYIHLDEMAALSQLQPETVDIITEPVSGEVIGYNVTEHVELVHPTSGKQETWVYLKQYRLTYTRITRWRENEDQGKGEILFERAYVNGQSIDTQVKDESGEPIELQVLPDEIDRRTLPVIHLANEPEPKFAYGFSDLQNTLISMRNYTALLEEATKRDVYNNNPLLFFKGVKDPAESDDKTPTTSTDNKSTDKGAQSHTVIDQDTIVYADKDADGKYITIDGAMGDTKDLLQIYFYLIAQASETPEFVFAMAIQSSKASTETQLPVVMAKAERKRRQMRRQIVELINLYIERQVELSNPDFSVFHDIEPNVAIHFPPVMNDDGQLQVDIVKTLLQEKAISAETAVQLLLGDKVDDAAAEVAKAQVEAIKAEIAEQGIRDRLNQETQAAGTGASGGSS